MTTKHEETDGGEDDGNDGNGNDGDDDDDEKTCYYDEEWQSSL